MNLKIDTLGKKIGFGYFLITLVLALSVLATVLQVRRVNNLSTQLIQVRQPSARADLELLNGLNRSIGEIRGWILFKKDTFKTGRKASWNAQIRPALANLQELSRSWTLPENVEQLAIISPMIDRMEHYQDQVEDLTLTDTEAAIALMNDKLLPLNKEILDKVTVLMDSHEQLMLNDFASIDDQISFLHTIEWVLLGAGILVSLLLALFITRSITSPVAGAVNVAQNIGAGNLQTAVEVGGSTELEMLGNALREMRDSLIRKTEEAKRYDWTTTGQNQLNEQLRGDQTTEELGTNTITFLSNYLNADVGAIYLTDEQDDTLSLIGRFAYPGNGKLRGKIAPGDTLVGQAALERKVKVLSRPENGSFSITTAALEISPEEVIALPFVFEGVTLGVVELGRLTAFSETERSFLTSAMESIAISFNSAIARRKIQELLEETRVQSEELQSQQEELRQINEELEEQAQSLRQQQEELQVTNEELEEQTQSLEMKNREVEQARLEIETKSRQVEMSSRYKSEFLANMSHELRTPLNSLLILSRDLSENRNKNLTEDQVESAQIIYKSGNDLLQLINEVLDLSKIEAGKMSLDVRRTSLPAIIEDISRSFKLQAQQKGLMFTQTLDSSLPEFIYTDVLRLNQILKNLLSNAMKFTEKGSVTLKVGVEDGTVVFLVEDTGIGIPESKQALIFEAFHQGDGGTSRKYGGTGLGLSISRELTKLLGGDISVSSTPGKGSTFKLKIPLDLREAHPIENGEAVPDTLIDESASKNPDFLNYPTIADDRQEITEKDRVILIVEDDAKFAAILQSQAHSKGFKCLVASTGEDGLALTEKYLPHAIILDLDLPGINGHQVLSLLKSNQNLRHIPVHIISVEASPEVMIKEGALEYLTKPVEKQALDSVFQRIESFIARKMKNLLIVEDDKNLRKAIKKLIGNGDVKCMEAETGQEALDILSKTQIDCMVLDIGLPDINGFNLVKQLNESGNAVPPIVVYTGKELTKEQDAELQAYAESIIIKGAKSEERLLDETALFLHRTIRNLPEAKKQIIGNLYDKEAIFQNKKILVTDDDMRNVFALSKILKERGMQVLRAENGKVALQILEKESVDMILMDIMMPEMDGYETMRAIRAIPKFKSLPMLALTAKAMKDDKQKCIDAGANDYIAKPVDTDRLLSLMSVWLNK